MMTNATVNSPKGSLDGPVTSFTVYNNDQITKADDFNSVFVAYRNGAPVRVGDIGRAVSGPQNRLLAGWQNGKRGVQLLIFKQPGANVINTVELIKAKLPKLVENIPPSVHVSTIIDRTLTIRASVSDVEFTLMLSIALVVMVIFVFLRNVWATIIPSVTVPLALVGTCGAMYLCGFSLDNLSLMASRSRSASSSTTRSHAREHLPAYRGRHEADGGRRWSAPARSASPSSRSACR